MSDNIALILKTLGWTDDLCIPIANEDNTILQHKVGDPLETFDTIPLVLGKKK